MFTIAKRFSFSASHKLAGLAPEHPCSRLHGHNYEVELILRRGSLDDAGMVVDYRTLDAFKSWIDATLDHRDLNENMDRNPTAEILAAMIFRRWQPFFPTLAAVRVSETPKTWAEYTP